MCLICGWIYEEARGCPEDGIPEGTPWGLVPESWSCPECGAGKQDFEMVQI
ncbi:MAG: rubredoxin [Giesbergeria sp.]